MSRWDGCDICIAQFNPVPFEEDMGENSEPIVFSKNYCDMFLSSDCHLPGERYIIHDGDKNHMEVCGDCYLKHHGIYEQGDELVVY